MKLEKIALFVVAILLVIAIYLLFTSNSRGEKCLMHPLVYGVVEYSKQINKEIICTCSAYNFNSFIVSKDGINGLSELVKKEPNN